MHFFNGFVVTSIIVHNFVLVNRKNVKGGKFLNNSKFTDWGLKVRVELLSRGKNLKWLEEETANRTGLFVDNSYLYKVLTGQRNAPKIVKAINEILDIKE